MAGALTERAFVERMEKLGFAGISVLERKRYGIDDLAAEPLFPRDLIEMMRRLLPADVQDRIGVRIVVAAEKSEQPAMSSSAPAS